VKPAYTANDLEYERYSHLAVTHYEWPSVLIETTSRDLWYPTLAGKNPVKDPGFPIARPRPAGTAKCVASCLTI